MVMVKVNNFFITLINFYLWVKYRMVLKSICVSCRVNYYYYLAIVDINQIIFTALNEIRNI